MICCSDPMPTDLTVDLPGPPWELVDCPNCGGSGAHLSLHPLYAGAEPCDACFGDGQIMVESAGTNMRLCRYLAFASARYYPSCGALDLVADCVELAGAQQEAVRSAGEFGWLDGDSVGGALANVLDTETGQRWVFDGRNWELFEELENRNLT